MTSSDPSLAVLQGLEESPPLAELITAVERADSADQLLRATRALANALERQPRRTGEEPASSEALSCLVRILGYNNPGAAVAAVDGLIATGPAAVSALLDGLDAQNYGARAWAIRALAGIGDVRGLDLLEQALADDIGPSVRRAAAIGLGTLNVEPLQPPQRATVLERSLNALQAARQDGEWVVRYAVATALDKLVVRLHGREHDRDSAIATLASLADIAQEEVPVVRLRATLALTRHREP